MQRKSKSEIRGPGGSLPLRPSDHAAQDLALLLEGETSGRALPEVLAEFGISRTAYSEKMRRFREAGLAGLMPRRPGPRGPWRRTIDVVRFVVCSRLQDPRRSAASIAKELHAQGARVSARSVERTLAQFGLTSAGAGASR